MDKIKWCALQVHGISIVKQDNKLVEEYLRKSLNALKTSDEVSDIEWRISARYYAMYFALYAVLTKIGIKCEMHDCTIEFMKIFLGKLYSASDNDIMISAKKARIDTQYYVGRVVQEISRDDIHSFIRKCRGILSTISPSDISMIRSDVQRILDQKV